MILYLDIISVYILIIYGLNTLCQKFIIIIKIKESTINYGIFIQNVIDFLIVAFCVFLLVKFVNRLSSIADKKKKQEEKKD